MRFLVGVIVGLVVAPTVNAIYQKNKEAVDTKIVDGLQRIVQRFGYDITEGEQT